MEIRMICCFFLAFLFGCTNKNLPKVSFDIKRTTCDVSEVFTDREIVFLETKKESLLSMVNKVIRWEDKIYVWDKYINSIVIFDTTGKYLSAIRPSGRGPREYAGLSGFALNREKGELIVYASQPNKFLFYDLNGNYKDEVVNEHGRYGLTITGDKDRIVLVNTSGKKGKPFFTFLSFDDNHKISSWESSSFTEHVNSSMYAGGDLLLNGERLTFARRFDNILYSLKGEKVIPRYLLDFKDHNVPESLFDPANEDEEKKRRLIDEDYIFSMVNVKETPSSIFFTTNCWGMMRITKNPLKGEFWAYFTDKDLGIIHSAMIGVEDPSNRMVCFNHSIYGLKSDMKDKWDQMPEWFANKIKNADDGDNPLLIFYKNKE